MKGKSLAKTLEIILYISRIIVIIALIGIVIGAIGVSALIIYEDQFLLWVEKMRENPDVNIEADIDVTWTDIVGLIASFVGFYIAFKVISRLREILNSISREKPFEAENATRLSRIAKYLVWGQVASIVLLIMAALVPGDLDDWNINLTSLLAAGIAAVLAEVFREGARMREEQEFTV